MFFKCDVERGTEVVGGEVRGVTPYDEAPAGFQCERKGSRRRSRGAFNEYVKRVVGRKVVRYRC
jgi:hypothetical protein